MTEPLLADAATGRTWKAKEAPCAGIAYLWNNRNFWVNLRCLGHGVGVLPGVANQSFELLDRSQWAALFPGHKVTSTGSESFVGSY